MGVSFFFPIFVGCPSEPVGDVDKHVAVVEPSLGDRAILLLVKGWIQATRYLSVEPDNVEIAITDICLCPCPKSINIRIIKRLDIVEHSCSFLHHRFNVKGHCFVVIRARLKHSDVERYIGSYIHRTKCEDKNNRHDKASKSLFGVHYCFPPIP